MGYTVPNHTQTPNELFDEHMREMTGSELKIVLAICRQTFGWHKERDRISLSQLMELTGLTRMSVVAGIKKSMDRGLIDRRKVDGGFEYALILSASIKNIPGGSKKNILGSKGKGSIKSIHTKEKGNKYPYRRLKKDYTGGEFAAWIED